MVEGRRFQDMNVRATPHQLMPSSVDAANQTLDFPELGSLIGNQQYSQCTAP
jgi:hypothetical protein